MPCLKTARVDAMTNEVLVLGAGPAGLAVAHELRRRQIQVRVLDGATKVAEPWRARHEALVLNTHRRFSGLPGMRIPRSVGAYPTRDEFVRYLEAYAGQLDVPFEWEVCVERVDSIGRFWRVETNKGACLARHVVVATGPDRIPHTPKWPGMDLFPGRFLHASQFRRAEDHQHRRVLVIGGGTSGFDIASALTKIPTRELWLSVRGGPVVIPRRLAGIPLQATAIALRRTPRWYQDLSTAHVSRLAFGDLKRHGLPDPTEGAYTRFLREGVAPSFDDGFVAALDEGLGEVVPEVEAFGDVGVRLTNGRILTPDVVICATGYRTGLDTMVGHLGVLDDDGRPKVVGAPGDAPGLWFAGQRSNFHGNLHARGREARQIAKAIRKERRRRRRDPDSSNL